MKKGEGPHVPPHHFLGQVTCRRLCGRHQHSARTRHARAPCPPLRDL